MSRTERSLAVEDLRAAPDLEVYLPGDPGYDEGRATWNVAVEHSPLAVAMPRSAQAVAAVVRAARRAGLGVAIQSTGHGPVRPVHDAILINMSRLTRVDLDVAAQRATIGGGAKWQAVLDVILPHGLAPLLGSTPDVSAVGYTMGGGLGWLSRKYGTSADSVHSFEVVTADGEIVRVADDQHSELFWALRGAGAGHLCVVTAMEVQLYPIAQLYAGNLWYAAEDAAEIMARWREWVTTVPEDLTSAVTMLNMPPFEEIPEEIRGQSFVLVRGAYDGAMEDGERLMSYWRDWKAPVIDQFGPMPFATVADISQDPVDPVPNEGTGLWLRSLGDGTINALANSMFPHTEPSLFVQTEIRHGGGALARGGARESAFGNRDAAFLLELVGITPTPDDVAAVRAEIHRLQAILEPDLSGGVYLNYVEGDDRRHGVERGIGRAAYERLAAVKAAYDPDNVFDHGLDVTGA